ncbi:MAG: FAD-binding oxidoreductase [Acidimicrobiales bacterium]
MTGAPDRLRPASLAEAREAMMAGAEGGAGEAPVAGGRAGAAPAVAVAVQGAGTKWDWGAPGPPPDVVVDTTGLDRLVSHNDGDLTAVVQAGMPLARLQERLAGAGQWLALDPASALRGATVGGILATGDAGPRRHRYGTMRELAIGVTVVLPDGAVARSGGQVIKNVAGYDLGKLLCGSLGTLGLVAEVSVRLHPLPATSATVRVESSPAAATGFVVDLLGAPVVPSAVELSGGATWVRVEGVEAGVRAQVEQVAELASAASLPASVVEGEEEEAAWAGLSIGSDGEAGETVARAATLPSRLGEVAEALGRAAGEAGVGAALTSHAGLGLHTARLSGGGVAGHAAAVRGWRSAVSALAGTVVVRRRPPGLEDLVDVWGPAPSALALMRRVKERLDPEGRLGQGRFSPWW